MINYDLQKQDFKTIDVCSDGIVSPIYLGNGLLDQVGSLLDRHTETRELILITDASVAKIYGKRLMASLATSNYSVQRLDLELDNTQKVMSTVERIHDYLLEHRANWGTTVLLMGGNVLIDSAGFAAATFCRGIRFVLLPTTLLAQSDGAIGGALGVHFRDLTNYVGIKRFPLACIMDPEMLTTLPIAEYRCGISEIVKQAAVGDLDLYREMLADPPAQPEPHRTWDILERTVALKAAFIPKGEDRRLNFGHTIGHALENLMKHKDIRHGEGVAIGMRGEMMISERLGRLDPGTTQEFERFLIAMDLPIVFPTCAIDQAGSSKLFLEQLWDMCWLDKKVFDGKLRWIVPVHPLGTYDFVEPDQELVMDVFQKLLP